MRLELDTILSQKNVYFLSFEQQNQPFIILAGFSLVFMSLHQKVILETLLQDFLRYLQPQSVPR